MIGTGVVAVEQWDDRNGRHYDGTKIWPEDRIDYNPSYYPGKIRRKVVSEVESQSDQLQSEDSKSL